MARHIPAGSRLDSDDDPTARLAELVLQAAEGDRIEVDDRYVMTAFVVHRNTIEGSWPVVVELLDRGAAGSAPRWQAMAYDEAYGRATHLGSGDSPEQALADLDWLSLDRPDPARTEPS